MILDTQKCCSISKVLYVSSENRGWEQLNVQPGTAKNWDLFFHTYSYSFEYNQKRGTFNERQDYVTKKKSRIGVFWGSLLVNLSFTIKDPPFFSIRITYWKKGGSLVLKLNFSTKDPPFFPIRITYYNFTNKVSPKNREIHSGHLFSVQIFTC